MENKNANVIHNMDEVKTGNRFNSNKLRWRNIPLFLIRPMIEVGQQGEHKYGTYNYLKGLKVSDCLDSLMRHLDDATDPNRSDIDAETKKHHLYSVAWNALVAAYMIENRPELDDRFKGHE